VRPVSHLRLNQLFSINKVSTNCLVISHLCGFATIFYPCYRSFGYSLSHQYSYFRWPTQGTKPPTFSHVVEPMDADDWLKSVEKKLQLVQCNNHEKVLLASHQLFGPTADWWDAYMEVHEEPVSIN
jgi:hypothetical protein